MTNKENTRNVILSIYGRSDNTGVLNTIDIDYLIHIVQVTSVNDRKLYNHIHCKSKPVSVAKGLIASIINIDLYFQGYKTTCTYNQIRNILKTEFNYNIQDLENILASWIFEERKELQDNE